MAAGRPLNADAFEHQLSERLYGLQDGWRYRIRFTYNYGSPRTPATILDLIDTTSLEERSRTAILQRLIADDLDGALALAEAGIRHDLDEIKTPGGPGGTAPTRRPR